MVRAGWLKCGKMVIYPIRERIDGEGRQLVNWVAEIETPRHQQRDWNRRGSLDDFLGAFEGWHFDWLDQLEGTGAYTAVDGERTTMRPGDFILTPSWTFHDHGNPGSEPVIWLDGLDIPMVAFFDAGFAERYPEEVQPVAKPERDSLARYGSNLLPLEYTPASRTTPIFSYPYDRTREALGQLRRNGPLHPCHGAKMQYANPATGGYPMPTIAAFIQMLPAGFRGKPCRSTDGTVYAVVEGRGRSTVGDQTFDWGPRDVFVVPSWAAVSHEAGEDAVLFSFSDRPVQKALGLWREEVVA